MAQNVSNPYQFNILLPTKFSTSAIQKKPGIETQLILNPTIDSADTWSYMGFYSKSNGGQLYPKDIWKYPVTRLCYEQSSSGNIFNRYSIGVDFGSSIGTWGLSLFSQSGELLFSIPSYTEIAGITAYFYADATADINVDSPVDSTGLLGLLLTAIMNAQTLELKLVLYPG